MPITKNQRFIKPKQERSQKRFDEVIKTAEFIYMSDDYDLTVQDIAKISGLKRPSIYKFFPSNESLLEAISEKHTNKLLLLIKKNFKSVNYKNISGLSNEVIEKLNKSQPTTIGSASRIEGVTPAAINLILIQIKKREVLKQYV